MARLGAQEFSLKKPKTSASPLKSAAAVRGSTFRAVKTRTCLARFRRVGTKNSSAFS